MSDNFWGRFLILCEHKQVSKDVMGCRIRGDFLVGYLHILFSSNKQRLTPSGTVVTRLCPQMCQGPQGDAPPSSFLTGLCLLLAMVAVLAAGGRELEFTPACEVYTKP